MGKASFTGDLPGSAGARLEPVILAQTRVTISLFILAPVLLALRGRDALSLDGRNILRCFLLGTLGLAASNFFYYYAIDKTSVATAIVLQYTAPIWVLVYMVARGLQRATPQRVSAVLLAFTGSGLAIGAMTLTAALPFLHFVGVTLNPAGVVAAQLAAVSFAFYNIYGQGLVAKIDRWKVLAYALAGAALFWMVVNPPWKVMAAGYSTGQWTFMAVFALTSMLLPFSFYFAGLQYLDPTRAIVTSCLEPVFAILIAAMFIHERLGFAQVVGIVIVLLATVLIQVPPKTKT